MAITKVTGHVIDPITNITSHNINSSGIITATRFDGPIGAGLTDGNFSGIITAAQLNVTGVGTFNGIGVTSLNVSGVTTFSDTVEIVDGKKILLGNSDDLQIWHDNSGGHSRIDDVGTGGLVLRGSNILLEKYGGGYLGNFKPDNSVDLYFAGSKKFETTNTGAIITGICTATTLSLIHI